MKHLTILFLCGLLAAARFRADGTFNSMNLCLFLRLGSLGTVLGTSLHTVGNALSVEGTADDVVTDTGQVTNTAAANQNDAVLLQVMTDTGNVSSNFHRVGQTDSCNLTERGVRLFGGTRERRGSPQSL